MMGGGLTAYGHFVLMHDGVGFIKIYDHLSSCDGVVIFFFFSSRRRHTIFDCDWSSDVCSSDLSQSVRAMRARRTASDLWPHQPLRGDGAVVDAGSPRPDLPLRRGLRDCHAGEDRKSVV